MKTAIAERDDPSLLTDEDRKRLAEICRLIANPPETSRVIKFTPGLAFAVIRDFNRSNRPQKPRSIRLYADDMDACEWALTGDTLKFSDAHLLRDGQNRLQACVQAGKPFTTHVVFGIEDAYFDRMDRGKNRDGSDLLAIAGYSNVSLLATAVRWIRLIETGRAKGRETFEPKETLRLLQNNYPTLPNYVPDARRIVDTTKQPGGIVLAFVYMFHRVDPKAAQAFSAAWAAGKWGGAFAPIGLMQAALMRMHEVTNGRVHETVRAAHILTAWNLYIQKRKGRLSNFNWSTADDFPELFGSEERGLC